MTSPLLPGTALVTGASSGIGAVYAEKLARRGYDLVLVGRNTSNLKLLAESLTAQTDRRVEVLAADLADSQGIAAVEARLRDDASLTLLVNNAGLAANGPLSEVDAGALTNMLTVNVLALTRLASVAGAAFAARKRGGIINLASAMAFIDTPRSGAYAASKAYVLNLTLSLDMELAPSGVQVQVVVPGYTRTPMIDARTNLPAEQVMETTDLVDAALIGFDRGELVTIPSLEAVSLYESWVKARTALLPFLSLNRPASRYGV